MYVCIIKSLKIFIFSSDLNFIIDKEKIRQRKTTLCKEENCHENKISHSNRQRFEYGSRIRELIKEKIFPNIPHIFKSFIYKELY